MRMVSFTAALLLWAPAANAQVSSESIRTAVEKGLRRIEQGAANYTTHRQCFSCHHQALSILTMTSARQRGFVVDSDKIQQQIDFTLNTFRPQTAKISKGQGIAGGNTTAIYALMCLKASGHRPDETTLALVQYLVGRQRPDGSWPAVTNRPPTEGSSFTNTALALSSLRAYGPAAQEQANDEFHTQVESALAKGKTWLLQNKPQTTEDKVFQLRGLVYAETEKREIEAARKSLLEEQGPEGSWAQLPDLKGDAYATGTVLMALRAAGVECSDPVYQKAAAYLLKTQTPQGAWIVETRSRPVQVFFDNGDPGGQSQFISFTATNWALLALLEILPVQ